MKKIELLEILTILASLMGIFLSLSHGNLYDYFFDFSNLEGFWYLKILNLSLFTYSFLSLIVFTSLLYIRDRNDKIRFLSYLQGWLFLLIAAFAFEWLDSLMLWNTYMVLSNTFVEYPFTLPTKGASVIFFSALFLFWIVENKKRTIRKQ